jgi:hypothetical protein
VQSFVLDGDAGAPDLFEMGDVRFQDVLAPVERLDQVPLFGEDSDSSSIWSQPSPRTDAQVGPTFVNRVVVARYPRRKSMRATVPFLYVEVGVARSVVVQYRNEALAGG